MDLLPTRVFTSIAASGIFFFIVTPVCLFNYVRHLAFTSLLIPFSFTVLSLWFFQFLCLPLTYIPIFSINILLRFAHVSWLISAELNPFMENLRYRNDWNLKWIVHPNCLLNFLTQLIWSFMLPFTFLGCSRKICIGWTKAFREESLYFGDFEATVQDLDNYVGYYCHPHTKDARYDYELLSFALFWSTM